MREKLLKIAIVTGIAGLLPLLFILLRQNTAPPDVHIKKTKQQTIKNFVFLQKESNQIEWQLTAPEARFIDNHITLKNPELTLSLKNPVIITAQQAIYYQKSNRADFKSVKLIGHDFTAITPEGKFNGKTQTFYAKTCSIKFSNSYTIKGKGCTINLKTGKVIINSGVKTVISSSEEK